MAAATSTSPTKVEGNPQHPGNRRPADSPEHSPFGPSDLFAREKFIFVYQDIRGRYMSEGDYVVIRPLKPVKNGPKDTDESTDTFDTVDWLIKNVPGNTGKAGMYGISQPGYYATAGMIEAHPALVAVAPQAPVTDYYMGDDSYHNGAFMLAHRFIFYMGFRNREGDPETPRPSLPRSSSAASRSPRPAAGRGPSPATPAGSTAGPRAAPTTPTTPR